MLLEDLADLRVSDSEFVASVRDWRRSNPFLPCGADLRKIVLASRDKEAAKKRLLAISGPLEEPDDAYLAQSKSQVQSILQRLQNKVVA